MKEKLIAIVGPTAVGKTKMSVELAKVINGEIINADSMQVYQGMDIGTAKITEDEKENIPHHLFDIKHATESYSVAEFQALAQPLISDINKRGKVPILVGGTGLYIKAVTHNYKFLKRPSVSSYRKILEQFVVENGEKALHERLKSIDPASYENIHPHNVKRVIRALEIYYTTGKAAGERQGHHDVESPYQLVTVGLSMEREQLYHRINARVDQMVADGLIVEAKQLYESGVHDCQSVQAIGYKEIYEYLKGECTKEEAIALLKRNSRRYAKRQYTWFKHQMDVNWFEVNAKQFHKKIADVVNFVQESFKR